MKNPLKDMSRPKALGLAGVAAGVLAISGGAAAMNVGLLSSGASEPFTPEPVSVTEEQPTTTSTASDPVVVYEDVYETVPAPTTVAPAPTPTPAVGYSDDDSDDDAPSYGDDSDDSDDQGEYEDSDDEDSEDHDSEDHEDEDEDEDDGEDDGEDD